MESIRAYFFFVAQLEGDTCSKPSEFGIHVIHAKFLVYTYIIEHFGVRLSFRTWNHIWFKDKQLVFKQFF